VVDHGARIVNLSLGDPSFVFTSLLGTAMRDGIEYAWLHGAVSVVAAGNTNLLGLGIGRSNYGDLDAIVVGATGPDDTVASYSSPVGNAKWSILAPGGAGDGSPDHDIFSTYWEAGKTNSHNVAGAIADLPAEGHTPQEAVQHLLETADPKVVCDGPNCTDGTIWPEPSAERPVTLADPGREVLTRPGRVATMAPGHR
jgi:hypothetical protein